MTNAQLDSGAAPRSRAATPPIAVLMSRFPSVTETFILREMIEMERQGQAVRLVPMLKESPPVLHEEAKPWTARALYTPYLSAGIVGANLRMLARSPLRYAWLFTRLALGTFLKPLTLVKTLALFPKSVFLAERLEREGIRHVHAHYASFPATMALIIARLSNITFSFTVHAHDIQVDRSLLRWKLRETRFVRSISDFNRKSLEGAYPKEAAGKIDVIHVGIEPQVYEARAAEYANVTSTIPRVLCVAAHKPYKGIPVLIEACRILKQAGVAFRCEVVGDGPMRAELNRMIHDREVSDVISLVGPKPQNVVARMMAESTIFVLASIVADDGQMEGIPVALMEAMASGRAVVSTALSGIPELIDHRQNGIVVPPSDPQALADAMRELLENPHTARAMGSLGPPKVRREFTISDCVARLVARLEKENAGEAAA